MNSVPVSLATPVVVAFTAIYMCGFVFVVALGAFLAIRFDRWLLNRK